MSLFLLKCEFIFKSESVPLFYSCLQATNQQSRFFRVGECDVYSDKKPDILLGHFWMDPKC